MTVGGPPDVSESPDESDENDHEQNNLNTNLTPAQAVLTGRVATVAMVLGALAHIASVLLRGLAANRWPWGNMFEFIVAVCLAGVIAWIVVVARKLVARRLGLFTMLTTVIMLGVATRVYTEAGPLVPALDSYWIAIHVLAAIVAFGIFMVGFVTAVLHLIKRRWVLLTERRKRISFPFTLGQRLPLAETLERITWRLHVLAFPLWTFGVIAGAVWARNRGAATGDGPQRGLVVRCVGRIRCYLHSRAPVPPAPLGTVDRDRGLGCRPVQPVRREPGAGRTAFVRGCLSRVGVLGNVCNRSGPHSCELRAQGPTPEIHKKEGIT